MSELTHRDEIHGDVEYDALAVELLNTASLQRLGRVYQLGYGHLVYRGGTHTRLSHSMGTYATAGRLVAALRRNYERRAQYPGGAINPDTFLPRGPARPTRSPELVLPFDDESFRSEGSLADRWVVLRHLVCWAGLVHDVGHVPLGHTLEDEFEGIYEKHDRFSSPRLRHLWLEDRRGHESEIRVVLKNSDLYPEAFHRLELTSGDDIWGAVLLICVWKETIEKGERTTFEEILTETIRDSREAGKDPGMAPHLLDELERLTPWLFQPYMTDIVANTISADYLDYLRRDPQNLGLDVLRDDRVVSQFWVGHDHRGQARMALSLQDRRGKRRLDTSTGVVDLVRQRYRFAEIVYYHKTKVSASAMLAKVFHLIGAPEETPAHRELPPLEEAGKLADGLLGVSGRERADRLRELRSHCLPSSLLDPEVGDESLGILLRERAWQQLERAVENDQRSGVVDALHSITLLDAIARRLLYKVAFTMDFDQFRALGGRRDSPKEDVERGLKDLILRLRKDAAARAGVEADMIHAAPGWPDNSLLLYVPPRKSQAKGIETGALADGTVVTLGDHPAVRAAVQDLSDHYAGLWRLIVLVHPDHCHEVIGLSDAIDGFVLSQFPGTDLRQAAIVDALESCCWFPYLRLGVRPAARRLPMLVPVSGEHVDWTMLAEYERIVDGRPNDEELAYGAAVLHRVRTDSPTAKTQLASLGPQGLTNRVHQIRGEILASAAREGARDDGAELRATQAALDRIVDELT